MVFIELESLKQWNSIIDTYKTNSESTLILYYSASWCAPCKAVFKPFVDGLKKLDNVIGIKIDVDKFDKLSTSFEISCMPTFIIIKKGKIIKRVEGADLKSVFSSV